LVLLVVLAAALAALWSRAPLTLGQLRGIELLSIGVLTAYFAWLAWYFKVDPLKDSAGTLAHVNNGSVMLIVFGYGVFIPNTWPGPPVRVPGVLRGGRGKPPPPPPPPPAPGGFSGPVHGGGEHHPGDLPGARGLRGPPPVDPPTAGHRRPPARPVRAAGEARL